MSFAKTLSRDEMKNVKAGGCSNLYCSVGGNQTWMGSSCFGDTLGSVTNACIANEDATGNTCGGCAEFA
jgi:hypothetical protein